MKYAYDTRIILCCFRKVQHSLVMVLYFDRQSDLTLCGFKKLIWMN